MPYLTALFEELLETDEVPDVTHLLEECDPDETEED